MHPLDPSATITSLVLSHPAAARTFERFGIDCVCRTPIGLEEACHELSVPVAEVMADLQRELNSLGSTPPSNSHTNALIDYIIEHHHAFARQELERLLPLAAKVEQLHAEQHRELVDVHRVLRELNDELLPHMLEEELVFFPLLRTRAEAKLVRPALVEPIHAMRREHEEFSRRLKALRELTRGYSPPHDACTSLRLLYGGLHRLSSDLQQHIHLENDVLLPVAEEPRASERSRRPSLATLRYP